MGDLLIAVQPAASLILVHMSPLLTGPARPALVSLATLVPAPATLIPARVVMETMVAPVVWWLSGAGVLIALAGVILLYRHRMRRH